MISWSRVLILLLLVLLLVFFWNSPVLIPVKVFVVYLHEISHAIAAYLTGGEVLALSISWNESGYVNSRGGVLWIVTMAGYVGSMIWGSLMLYYGLKGRSVRVMAMVVGITLLVFTLVPDKESLPTDERLAKTISGMFWGLTFVLSAALFERITHGLLFFMGGLTSLYSLYDLDDFFAGRIMETDAGVLARNIFPNSGEITTLFAYSVAFTMSLLSITILYFILRHSLRHDDLEEDEELYDEGPDHSNLSNLPQMPPEMIQWLDEVRASKTDRSEKE